MFDAGFTCARSCSVVRANALYTRTASHKNLNIPLAKEVCFKMCGIAVRYDRREI